MQRLARLPTAVQVVALITIAVVLPGGIALAATYLYKRKGMK